MFFSSNLHKLKFAVLALYKNAIFVLTWKYWMLIVTTTKYFNFQSNIFCNLKTQFIYWNNFTIPYVTLNGCCIRKQKAILWQNFVISLQLSFLYFDPFRLKNRKSLFHIVQTYMIFEIHLYSRKDWCANDMYKVYNEVFFF